jgi:hypothetical protein
MLECNYKNIYMRQNFIRIKPLLLSISSILLLFSVVAISLLTVIDTTQSKGNHVIQLSYAQASSLRTTEIKVDFKKLIQVGNTERIRVFAHDQATGLPVSGAVAKITITYPGGTPIRQFNLITDANGLALLSLPISSNAVTGAYGLDLTVSATGYLDSDINGDNFAVRSHVDLVSLHHYSHIHSSIHRTHHHN